MSYLYAVQMNIFGYPFFPVKIGLSGNPDLRAKAYTSGPFPTQWLGSWPDENACVSERQIHTRFQEYRLAGEWFYPATGLIRFIEAKVGIPIKAMMSCPPSSQQADFEQRFVRLFPNGISSIDAEWVSPGKAKPCSDRAFSAAQKRLDKLEESNPLKDTVIWQGELNV